MLQTNTFILNLFCAAAFCVFILFGIFLCFSKKQMASVREYRIMGGISLLLLALHVLFLDYEIFLGTVQYADSVRIGIVITDFLVVVGFVIIALRGSNSASEELESNSAHSNKTEKKAVSIVPKDDDKRLAIVENTDKENIVPNPIEKGESMKQEDADVEANDVKAESSVLRVEGVDIEVKDDEEESVNVENTEIASESADEVDGSVGSGEKNAIDGSSVADNIKTEGNENTESSVKASDSADSSAKSDESSEAEDQPIDNSNIEDLIFFQKVEYLMAQKKLFCEPDISREQIASAVGTNRTYLTRSIKNATGKTFLEYITDLRTSYAATLLTTTNEPLDIIGTIAGFGSKSAYYRAFSAAYGCSPSEYRKR